MIGESLEIVSSGFLAGVWLESGNDPLNHELFLVEKGAWWSLSNGGWTQCTCNLFKHSEGLGDSVSLDAVWLRSHVV